MTNDLTPRDARPKEPQDLTGSDPERDLDSAGRSGDGAGTDPLTEGLSMSFSLTPKRGHIILVSAEGMGPNPRPGGRGPLATSRLESTVGQRFFSRLTWIHD